MRSILFLSSTLVLSACSMTGEQEFYDSPPSYQQSGSYNYGCGSGNCAPGQSYSVARSQSAGHYGQPYGASHHGPQQPSAHAYGSQVQHHTARSGHPPQLRGMHNPHARQGYKYGTLGAVAYDTDTDLYGIQGRLGYQSASYFGAEVEGSIGLTNESETVGAVTTDLDVDYQVGAFAVARAPIGNRFSVFSRLGYAATKFSAELDDGVTVIEDSDTFDGLAYGLGAEYAFDPRNSIRVDYTRYDLDGLDGETDAIALAFARKF